MKSLKTIAAVLQKDFRSELRSRHAINTVLAFVASALLLVLFALNADQLPPTPKSGIIWLIILFAALAGMARSFVAETDRQTYDLLRLHANAMAVFGGKLLYNFCFILAVNTVSFILYVFFLGMPIAGPLALFATLFFGSAGLASVTTMLAAIVSRADRRGAIFSVLSLPLLFPLILILVDATKTALFEGQPPAFWNNLLALIGYVGTTSAAGFLLFDFLWTD